MSKEIGLDADIKFMALVFSQCDQIKVNWKVVCTKAGYSRPDKVQQKFKKLIESTGKYGLVNGKVVDLEEDQDKDSDEPAAATPATPAGKRGRGGKTAATPRSTGGRKRKAPAKKAEVADADEDDVGDEEEATEAPVKKRANTGKKSATQTKVKKETAAATEANGDGGEHDGDGAEENGDGQSSDTDGAAPDVV